MRNTLRFSIMLGVGGLFVCVTSPFVAALLDALGLGFSVYRVWERMGMATLIAAALLVAPRRPELRADEHAFLPRRGWLPELASGFAGAVLLSVMLVCWLVLLGHVRFHVDFNWADDGLLLLLIAPVSAVTVALLEEWVFRGLLFASLRRDRGTTYAVLASSFGFAAVHFFHVSSSTPEPAPSAFSGFAVLGKFLGNVLAADAWLGFVGLFLLGLVFALARLLTGRLYLAIGLHAGFIFFNRMDGPFTAWNAHELTIWTGYRQYTAGLPGWLVFASGAGVLAYLVRRRDRLASLRPAPAPAPIAVRYESKQ